MTILTGDTGLVSVGTLKTFNITMATPNETLLASGSEIALPTAEPAGGAAGSVQITVQASDLPTIDPTPYSTKSTAFLILSGKNTTAGALTISYSVYKNGVSVATTTQSVAANNFWTHTHYRFYDVVPGDILEGRVWCATAGLNLDYYALVVYPTRMDLTKSATVQDLNCTVVLPTLTKGTPGASVTGLWNIYPSNVTNAGVGLQVFANFPSLCIRSDLNGFATGRPTNGDVQVSSNVAVHATNHPSFARNYYPSVISFREVSR